jgi:hypothetical protein
VAVTQIRPLFQALPVAPVVVEAPPIKSPASAPMATGPRATIAAVPAPSAPAPTAATETPAVALTIPPTVAPTVAPTPRDQAPSAKPRLPAPTVSAPPAQPEMDPLTREAAMLERARASLDRDPRASLAELDACAARFPSGTLRMERELLAVDALMRVGSRDEARRRGEALVAAARGSIYEPRVRSMLDELQAP